jgi:hypothetical protein
MSNPILFEGFDSESGWNAPFRGFREINTAEKQQGAASWHYYNDGQNIATETLNKTDYGTTIAPSELNTVTMYIRRALPYSTQGYMIVFGDGGTFPNPSYGDVAFEFDFQHDPNAGKWWTFHVSERPDIEGLTNIDSLRLRVYNSTSAPPNIVPSDIDALYYNAQGAPTVVIGFDDARPSQVDLAIPYASNLNVKTTLYIPTARIGENGRLTWADVHAAKAMGAAISLDGTPDDDTLLNYTDAPTGAAACASQFADLQAQGLDGPDMYHICYPFGEYHDNSISRIEVGTLTADGSNVVTFENASDIPAGATLYCGLSYDEANPITVTAGHGTGVTSVTVSENIPAGTAPAVFLDTENPFFMGKITDALKAVGIKSGRTTRQGSVFTRFGFANGEMTFPGDAMSNYSLNEAKALIDAVILRGESLEFYVHAIADDPAGWTADTPPSGGINTYRSTFEGIIDYLAEKQNNQELVTLTKRELYERDINSTPENPTSNVITAANQPPVANAGQDQSVAAGALVQVSASGSLDGDGTIVGWKWRETTNSGVTLSSTTAENINFTSPVSNTPQTVTLELIVTDDNGVDSAPVYVNFDVAADDSLNQSTFSITVTGAANGQEQVALLKASDLSTVIYSGMATVTSEVLTTTVDVPAGTHLLGVRLGANFPDTGGGIEGVTA